LVSSTDAAVQMLRLLSSYTCAWPAGHTRHQHFHSKHSQTLV